jgi:hypothetical protein
MASNVLTQKVKVIGYWFNETHLGVDVAQLVGTLESEPEAPGSIPVPREF